MMKIGLSDVHLRKEKAPRLAGQRRSEDGKSGKLGTLIVEHRTFDCKAIEVAFLVCMLNSGVVGVVVKVLLHCLQKTFKCLEQCRKFVVGLHLCSLIHAMQLLVHALEVNYLVYLEFVFICDEKNRFRETGIPKHVLDSAFVPTTSTQFNAFKPEKASA